MMRQVIAWVIAFVLSLAVQGSLMSLISIKGITPDLPLLTLFFFALKTGPLAAIVVGFILGLCQDLSGTSLLGQNALAGTLCGALAGLFNERVMHIGPVFKTILVVAVFVLHGAITDTVLIVKSGAPSTLLATDIFVRSLPRVFYSLVAVGAWTLWKMYLSHSPHR